MNRPARFAAALTALLLGAEAIAATTWIEHASKPGPDVSAQGESRFDQLFADSGEYRLPYPFDDLIGTLEKQVDNGKRSGVRQVFVPMGRSLQRDTAAPDYFRYPRRVIALEGEPVAAAGTPGRVLEYRLFIAHQPATNSLEIISYNDAAGRFEFQVVEDYDARRKPRVRPANRAMCLSCHQNAAPIFARTPWSETSFNVEVSKRLVEALPRRFRSLIDVVTLDAGVIDVLSERANYLAAAQLIWRRGCDNARCRAAMLRAVLQYRLSSGLSFDWSAPAFRRDYEARLEQNWAERWPRGLSLANSRIPDRNPFADAIDAGLDPLQARPPHATWLESDPVLARGIIFRLGGFFTLADIQRLDRFLIAQAAAGGLANRTYRLNCRLAPGTDERRLLSCGENAVQQPYAEIEIEHGGHASPVLRIAQLRMPRGQNLLQPDLLESRPLENGIELIPGYLPSGLSLRLANGDRVKSLLLQTDATAPAAASHLQIEIVSDFALVDAALENLIERQAGGIDNGLEAGVFRRARLLPALARQLGMPALDWPLTPAPAPEPAREGTFEPAGDLALLLPYCGSCHADPARHPPGFLHPDAGYAVLRQCAPRMLARLTAWQRPQATALAAMPPPASIETPAWAQSEHYWKLRSALESLIDESAAGTDQQKPDYAQLPACEVYPSE